MKLIETMKKISSAINNFKPTDLPIYLFIYLFRSWFHTALQSYKTNNFYQLFGKSDDYAPPSLKLISFQELQKLSLIYMKNV